MAWTTPQFSKTEVDRAGALLISEELVDDETWNLALQTINNWRSSHSYPLQALKMTLLNRAKKVDDRAIVAQRLKRLSSISVKLRRNPNMALSQMQDIGGCRAVVRTVRNVDALVALYEKAVAKNAKAGAEFVKKYDYIAAPKKDGYRSVHLVYKYRSRASEKQAWRGLRIETQIRSRLQHAWATAVETVDTFTAQSIKTGGGADSWRRFFLLMGSAIARMEKRPLCPDCPNTSDELKSELKAAIKELNVVAVLKGWSVALTQLPTQTPKNAGVYLLYLDAEQENIAVTGFPDSEQAKASEAYLETEKKIRGKESAQAVLVSVESIQALRSAFPNYFADTSVFLDAVNQAISSK